MANKNENLEKKVSPPSFIKLAMRNMVRKGSKSISHFFNYFFNFKIMPVMENVMELYIEWGFYFLLVYSGFITGYVIRFLNEPVRRR